MSARPSAFSARLCAVVLGGLCLFLAVASVAAADPHIWMVPGGTPESKQRADGSWPEPWSPNALAFDGNSRGNEPRLLVYNGNTRQIEQVLISGKRVPVVGNGEQCHSVESDCGDGGPAIDARLGQSVVSLAFGPKGNLYILESTGAGDTASERMRLRMVDRKTMSITTALDFSRPVAASEGGRRLFRPAAMSVSRDGTILIAGVESHEPGDDEDDDEDDWEDPWQGTVRALHPDGSFERVAGGGEEKVDGHDRLATKVGLDGAPTNIAATSNGGFVLLTQVTDPAGFFISDSMLKASREDGALVLRTLEARIPTTWHHQPGHMAKGPDGAVLFSGYCGIRELASDGTRMRVVAGSGKACYNGNARPARGAGLTHPSNMTPAPGGGFFLISDLRLRFIGPDDALEAELVKLVKQGTAAINGGDQAQVQEVIAELGRIGKLPTWKSRLDYRFGVVDSQGQPSSKLLVHFRKNLQLQKDIVKYIREYVQFNDTMEWMHSLRARMALQTINDRVRDAAKKQAWLERERLRAEQEEADELAFAELDLFDEDLNK